MLNKLNSLLRSLIRLITFLVDGGKKDERKMRKKSHEEPRVALSLKYLNKNYLKSSHLLS